MSSGVRWVDCWVCRDRDGTLTIWNGRHPKPRFLPKDGIWDSQAAPPLYDGVLPNWGTVLVEADYPAGTFPAPSRCVGRWLEDWR